VTGDAADGIWLAGADRCPIGWVVAFARPVGEQVHVDVVPRFADVLAAPEAPAIVAVDIPIGLPARVGYGGRAAENAVRPLLDARQSSVFSVPSRAALAAEDYREACRIALETSDPPRKVSKQLFMIAPKIREVDAGLLIHEGQLMFSQMGLHRVVDLGQWWLEQTGLPLPLGGNGVRRALGPEVGVQVAQAIRESVTFALEHREAAVNYAMQFARDMDSELADKFIGMYVNKWTLGYGERGRQAVREFLTRGVNAGLIPGPPEADFLSEE